jgi:hypothetical protein
MLSPDIRFNPDGCLALCRNKTQQEKPPKVRPGYDEIRIDGIYIINIQQTELTYNKQYFNKMSVIITYSC